jgi:hypothetical protein
MVEIVHMMNGKVGKVKFKKVFQRNVCLTWPPRSDPSPISCNAITTAYSIDSKVSMLCGSNAKSTCYRECFWPRKKVEGAGQAEETLVTENGLNGEVEAELSP